MLGMHAMTGKHTMSGMSIMVEEPGIPEIPVMTDISK